jgi:hypothetical protein
MLKYVVPILVLLMGKLSAQGYQYEGDCCWYNRLEVGADWIYWKASQEEMDMAAADITTGGGANITSTALVPDFSYKSGYKVYLTYDLGCDWTFYAGLTRLSSNAGVSEFFDPAAAIAHTSTIVLNSVSFPILLSITSDPEQVINSVYSSWDLNLYYLDLDIGRRFFSCRWLELGSYFGLRGMWMKQTLDLDAVTPNFQDEPGIVAFFFLDQQEKIRGVGIQGGMNGYWRIGCGFSLIGQFGGSLLYSRFNVNGDLDINNPVGATPTSIEFGGSFHKSIPTVDTSILLQYATCFCGHGVELHIGWENHLFFHTNFFGLSESGNLTMEGLTLGGSLRF